MPAPSILIVEDDAVQAAYLRHILTQRNYEVVGIAATGEDALARAASARPDVVLMDIRLMGEMNGIEAAADIDRNLDIPVIYLTAHSDEELVEKAKRTRPYAYLVKPVREHELRAGIEVAIHHSALDRQLKHLNQVLRTIRDINQLIVREKDAQRLLEQACQIVVQTRDYALAWVCEADDPLGCHRPIARAGQGVDLLDMLGQMDDETRKARFPCARAIETRQAVACQDIATHPDWAPWREAALAQGFRAGAALPILHAERVYGALCVVSRRVQAFDAEELGLLAELASDLGYALHSIEAETRRRQAEEALRETNDRLLRAQRIAHIGSWEDYLPTQDLHWSEEMYHIMGVPPNTPVNLAEAVRVFPPEELERFQQGVNAAIHEDAPYSMDYRIVRSDGSVRYIHDEGQVIRDEHGRAIWMFGTTQDITARKRAEAETQRLYAQVQARTRYLETLQQINATLRDTLPLSQVLTTITDGAAHALSYVGALLLIPDAAGNELVLGAVSGNRFVDAALQFTGLSLDRVSLPLAVEDNPMARAYLKGEFQELSGAPERIVVGVKPAISPKLAPLIERAMGARGATCVPLRAGAKVVGVLVGFSPRAEFSDEERAMLRGLADQAGLAIENARLFGEMQRLRAFNEAIVQGVAEAILIEDAQGVITFANPAAESLLGYNSTELIGRHWQTLVPQEERERVSHELATRPRGVESQYESALLAKDMRVIPVIVSARPLFEKGQFAGVLSAFTDITARKRAEEALRHREQEFSALVENAPDIIVRFDTDLRHVYCNPAVERQLGVPVQVFLGKAPLELGGPREQAEFVDRSLRQVLETGTEQEVEQSYPTPPGLKHFQTRIVPERDANGKIESLLAITRDITARKRGEDLLLEQTRVNQIFLDSFPCVALLLRPKTREIVAMNRAAKEAGCQLGGTCFGTWAKSQQPCPWCLAPTLWAEGSEQHIEVEALGIIWDAHWIPVSDDLYLHYAFDITARKRTEEALRESEGRHRTILQTAMDGFWLVDMQGRLLEANETYCRMSGYSAQELLAMCAPDLEAVETAEDTTSHIQKVMAQGEDRFESRQRRKDGTLFDVEVSVQYRPTDGGRLVAFLRDITARKRAEEERERLQAQLLQAQKMESVGRLAGGVAHDFNNMLGVIIGHAELALEQVDPAQPLHADLQEIRKAAQRSADLTRQLLAFARKQTVAPKVLDLNDAVSATLKMLRRLIGEDIDLAWMPGPGLWPVKMDPAQLDQILANLCTNARDAIAGVGRVAIETGKVTFDAAYCADHAGFFPGEYVLLTVSDNGCGMEQDVLEHLFEPFFTTKPVGQGTGLGLATVYGIVKQNEGFIHVHSEPGQGTTFRIYLPRFASQAEEVRATGAARAPRGRGETVLLVEDEPAILNMGKVMLQRLGYTVLIAHTVGAAIELAEAHAGEIHLLITDVVMPEMNGRDLAERLGAIKPGLKCLFMSGYTADVIARRGVLDEGLHFLQKPFSVTDLALKVREALEQK